MLAEAREYESPSSLRGKAQKFLRRFQKRKRSWWDAKLQEWLREVSNLYGGREVLFYASAFLEKPHQNRFSGITREDRNYLMDAFHGANTEKGLVLIIHTQGGNLGAVQGIVKYMHQMFGDITAVVPLDAMSGGSMINLACNRIVMGKQSQMGPIDPQIFAHGRFRSARSIVNTFNRACAEIMEDNKKVLVWNRFLVSMVPDLITEADNLLQLNEKLVSEWLQRRMFKGDKDAERKATDIVAFLNAKDTNPETGRIYMHNQGVGMDALRKLGVEVEALESCQARQDAVLTVYHLATLSFANSPAIKLIANHRGAMWYINPPHVSETQT